MAEATLTKTLRVPLKELYETIVAYTEYSSFVDGVSRVEVISQSDTQARVRYHINMMKEISYELDHTMQFGSDQAKVTWKLANSSFLTKNDGGWTLKALGPSETEATYHVNIEFNFPIPGFILNKLVKSSLPSMLTNFEKRARS